MDGLHGRPFMRLWRMESGRRGPSYVRYTRSMAEQEIATLGGGCFWCLEAVYQEMKGVESVVSGYMGGRLENPTYQEVGRGSTGHGEVVQVTFETSVVSFGDVLDLFFAIHDPGMEDGQGNDV